MTFQLGILYTERLKDDLWCVVVQGAWPQDGPACTEASEAQDPGAGLFLATRLYYRTPEPGAA